jgi:hypothetical protein
MKVPDTVARLQHNEAVRLYVYPGLIFLVGYLVCRGWVDADYINLALGLLGAAIGVPATEIARKKVWSQASVEQVATSAADAALDGVEPQVREAFGQQGVEVLNQVRETVGRHRKPE